MSTPLSTYADTPFQIHLSFEPIIENLEKVANSSSSESSRQARALLAEIAPFPELREGITDISQLESKQEIVSRLLADLFPAALTLNEIKAVSIPYINIVFNHTQRFQRILQAAGPGFDSNIQDFNAHQFYVNSCCLILNEHYHTRLDFNKPLFYDIPTADGIHKYYRILYNADFLEIQPTDKSVPLSQEDIDHLINNYDDLALWKEKFPKGSWLLKGFAIMTLFDATVENSVSILKEKFLGLTATGFQQSIESVFQSIYLIKDLQIGFTLFNPEEGKFSVAPFGQPMPSFLLPDETHRDNQEVLCVQSYNSLIRKKEYFAVSDTVEFVANNPDSHLAHHFLAQHIHSFILAPVVKNQLVLGVLEVVSQRPKELNSINANKLEIVMPFLTDTIERLVAELENQVQAVIQENYTSLHASVSWKLRAQAQRLIQAHQQGKKYALKEIVFPDVYPLYGQIDVKGSSEARNASVQKDLQKQLQSLLVIVKESSTQGNSDLWEGQSKKLTSFLREVALPLRASTEQTIHHYLDNRLHTHLKQLTHPSLQPLLRAYFQETDKDTGDFHSSRRRYETSMAVINETMVNIMDSRQIAMQAQWPHYYERFKSDGVDHTMYMGPSIAPNLSFSRTHLYDLRRWQIQVLLEMENAHSLLKPILPHPLDVASLILVFDSPIAIRFRMDEKRFDVDGTYHARYEIIKKRIDKARIKQSNERITSAGKLTIVYSNEEEGQEYRRYIAFFQSRNQLEHLVEEVDVEELQGVSGLKALRVNIIYHPATHEKVS